MQDWRRVAVGEAFRLPARNLNFYRDLFLLAPIILFAVSGAIHAFGPTHHEKLLAAKCAAIAAYAVLLARKRLHLILAALAFCAIRFFIAFALTHDARLLLALAASAIPVALAAYFARKHKRAYVLPTELDAVILLVVSSSSVLITLKLFELLSTTPF